MGVSHGDVILLFLPNSIYFPVIFLGILSLGAVVSPMNPLSRFEEVKKQTLDCCATFAFTTPSKSSFFDSLGVKGIRVPESFDLDDTQHDFSDFHKLLYSDPNLAPKVRIHQEDMAAIMYSSGTTGTRKGVALTHRNFISVSELFVRFEALQYEYPSAENVQLAVLPMFHIYGLSLFVMGILTLGSTIVVVRKFDGNQMVRDIERYKVTHFHVVPPLLMALTEKAKSAGRERFQSLKQVSSGAAPLSKKIIDEFVRVLPHVDFIQGYAMTESTAVGTRGFNTKNFRNYTSVGLLSPNTEAKVVDVVTGSFMPPGKRGELLLRGPGTMKGYLKNPEATAQAMDRDGWLRTGDIAYFDEHGYLYICDRLKEMIKFKGFQVAPAELESLLVTHPDVVDAAVTAKIDEEAGEIPVAFVVKRNGSQLTEAELLDYVAKQVSHYKRVRKAVFTQSIPKSAAGKILRKELKSLVSRL